MLRYGSLQPAWPPFPILKSIYSSCMKDLGSDPTLLGDGLGQVFGSGFDQLVRRRTYLRRFSSTTINFTVGMMDWVKQAGCSVVCGMDPGSES